MTGKERIRAALEGRPVDRTPVTVLYNQLYHLDHFPELTGRPAWKMDKWRHAGPEEHFRLFRVMHEKAPFEILQPQLAPSREERENSEYVEKDAHVFRHDKQSDSWHCLATVSGHARDYTSNETQYVFDREDADASINVRPARERVASGFLDYVQAAVAAMGKDHFVLTGGVIGTLYRCHALVGLTNLYAMLIQQPDLIEYLSEKILEDNIQEIAALGAGGGDAIYIDDAMTTCDMISVKHYERFCLPYVTEMVREIHTLGHKAILIYFGGVADRLEQIVSTGADGLSVEASMKNYTNDIRRIAEKIGRRITLFGNVDPVGVLQNASDAELEAEMKRQAEAAKKARGFIACTGSPVTPSTPLSRVQRFIELGRKY